MFCSIGLMIIGAGIVSTNIGLGSLALYLSALMLAQALVMVCLLFLPCRCGEEPCLTPYGRRQLRTAHPSKTIAISVFSVVAMVAAICLAHTFISGYLCGMFCGSALIVLGLITMVLSLTGQVARSLGIRLVPARDHARASQLSGDTVEELEQLIDYHLKAGNLERADVLSRRLLAMVEKAS